MIYYLRKHRVTSGKQLHTSLQLHQIDGTSFPQNDEAVSHLVRAYQNGNALQFFYITILHNFELLTMGDSFHNYI